MVIHVSCHLLTHSHSACFQGWWSNSDPTSVPDQFLEQCALHDLCPLACVVYSVWKTVTDALLHERIFDEYFGAALILSQVWWSSLAPVDAAVRESSPVRICHSHPLCTMDSLKLLPPPPSPAVRRFGWGASLQQGDAGSRLSPVQDLCGRFLGV